MKLNTLFITALLVSTMPASLAFAQDAAPQTPPADGGKADHPKGGGDSTGRPRRPRRGDHPGAANDKGVEVGKAAPAFTLTGADGKTYKLSDFAGKTVVLEWFCSTCPVSGNGERSYWGSGNAKKVLAGVKAADSDAVYLTIDSTKDGHDGKTTQEIGKADVAVIAESGQTVPVLIDADGAVGHAYGAKTTPHVFVIDPKGNVAYIGAPMSADGETDYITNAVTAIKAGKPVEPTTTKNKGCAIKYAASASKPEKSDHPSKPDHPAKSDHPN